LIQNVDDDFLPCVEFAGIGLEQAQEGLLQQILSIPRLMIDPKDVSLVWGEIPRGKDKVGL
jgi:hypothetical protein